VLVGAAEWTMLRIGGKDAEKVLARGCPRYQRTQSRSEEGDGLVGESGSGSRDSGADLTCGPAGVAPEGRRRDEGEGEGGGDGDGEGPSASSACCNSKYSPSTVQVPILDGKHQISNTHGVQ
jgi:hypothetical protein